MRSGLIRLTWYLLSCAVLALVLWWMTAAKPVGLLCGLWVVAWSAGLVVTWRVARREGRDPLRWVGLTFLIGPLAWIVIAIPPSEPREPVSRSGHSPEHED